MKIVRDNIEIKLTDEEMRQAWEDVETRHFKQDIISLLDDYLEGLIDEEIYSDVTKIISDLKEDIDKNNNELEVLYYYLGKNDTYWDAYWNAIGYIIENEYGVDVNA